MAWHCWHFLEKFPQLYKINISHQLFIENSLSISVNVASEELLGTTVFTVRRRCDRLRPVQTCARAGPPAGPRPGRDKKLWWPNGPGRAGLGTEFTGNSPIKENYTNSCSQKKWKISICKSSGSALQSATIYTWHWHTFSIRIHQGLIGNKFQKNWKYLWTQHLHVCAFHVWSTNVICPMSMAHNSAMCTASQLLLRSNI